MFVAGRARDRPSGSEGEAALARRITFVIEFEMLVAACSGPPGTEPSANTSINAPDPSTSGHRVTHPVPAL